MDVRLGKQHQHPLENSVVLQNIFQLLPITDLKSCRQVSRFWRDVSQVEWRSSAVAKIRSGAISNFQVFSRKYFSESQDREIQEAPFHNYHLQIEDSRWFYKFWGSSVKILKLKDVTFQSENIFLEAVFNFCQNLEKLALIRVHVSRIVRKRIDWDRNNYEEHWNLKSIIFDDFHWSNVVWEEFLSRLSSLQALTLSGLISKVENLFHSITAIHKTHPNKLKLKSVHLRRVRGISPFPTSPSIMSVLLDSRIELESVEFWCIFFSGFCTSFSKLLTSNASSLKKLVLSSVLDDDFADHFRFSLQKQLENLQELSITYQEQNFPLVNFLKMAPNLRKIVFRSSSANHLGVEDISDSGIEDIKLKYCTELELHVQDLGVQHLQHLMSWMPNMTKLKIHGLNNEMFSMICENWSNLVRFDVLDSLVDGTGITGLDSKDVEKINRKWTRGVFRPITVRRANITSLKDLNTFTLMEASFRGNLRDLGQGVAGYSVFIYGIEQMQSLKHFKFENLFLKGRSQLSFWKKVFAQYPMPKNENKTVNWIG